MELLTEGEIKIALTEEYFVRFCSETITEKRQTIEKSLCDGFEYAVRESGKSYDFFVDCHYTLSHDNFLSLKEYIANGYIQITFILIVECKKTNPLLDVSIIFPEYIKHGNLKYYPPDKILSNRVQFWKIKAQKTKPKYIFSMSSLIFNDTLQRIYDKLPEDFFSLLPSNFSPSGDWRQTFYDIKTGKSFLCNCFEKAIEKEKATFQLRILHPHVKYAVENNSYLEKICSLCTNTIPPENIINKSFAGQYSCYIYKTMIERNKSWHDAENIIRKIVGVPLIGEGWVTETYLFKKIESEFPGVEIIHHGRPHFLGRLEYDIWIPEYKIAIEFQGEQHKGPVDYFGGEAAFPAQQERDERKRLLSIENGVTLFSVEEGYNYSALIEKIKAVMGKS